MEYLSKIIEQLPRILEQLKTTKWWLVLALLLGGLVYLYQPSISKILEFRYITNSGNRIKDDLTKTDIINAALENLRYKTGADIAYIVLFHNGTVDSRGYHMNKMSRYYEVPGPGIIPRAMKYQNLPITLYSTTLDNIEKMKFHYGDIDEVEDLKVRIKYKEYGVTATSVAPVYNKGGDLIALIGVEYISRRPDTEMILWRNKLTVWKSDVMWALFLEETNEIGGLL